MIAFNFPASPANGASYTPVGGPTFTWDGTAWKALSQGMPVTVFVGDVAPTAPAFGNLWWESDTGNLYIYYNDGDSAQWVQINGTPAGYQTADSRNRIVNGGLQISQENGDTNSGGSATGGAFFAADQWNPRWSVSPATALTNRHPTTLSPRGGRTLMFGANTALTTPAVNSYAFFMQSIEGTRIADFQWGTAAAKPIVVRFSLYVRVAGLYSFRLSNGAADYCYVCQFNVPAAFTWTEIVAAVPGATGGVWATDTSLGLKIEIALVCGTQYQTSNINAWFGSGGLFAGPNQANAFASAGNNYLGDVGIYLDPDNTGVAPKWQMPDEAEELRACQRYFQQVYDPDPGTFYSAAAGGTVHGQAYNLPVPMRVAPSVALNAGSTRSYSNCALTDQSAQPGYYYLRVAPAAPGIYRAYGATNAFNARM